MKKTRWNYVAALDEAMATSVDSVMSVVSDIMHQIDDDIRLLVRAGIDVHRLSVVTVANSLERRLVLDLETPDETTLARYCVDVQMDLTP